MISVDPGGLYAIFPPRKPLSQEERRETIVSCCAGKPSWRRNASTKSAWLDTSSVEEWCAAMCEHKRISQQAMRPWIAICLSVGAAYLD